MSSPENKLAAPDAAFEQLITCFQSCVTYEDDSFSIGYASDCAEKFIGSLPADSRLGFTVGEQPLEAKIFSKNAYDLIHSQRKIIEPGEDLAFQAANRWSSKGQSRLYLRSGLLNIAVGGVVRSVCQEGGEISVIREADAAGARRR